MSFAWLPLAIFGQLANAAAFFVDKMLLNSAFKRSGTYAILMGCVSGLLVVASPWVRSWPEPRFYPVIAAFGIFFVFALWAFFEAMRREEASRVVPIVGALVPIYTWIGEWFFLGAVFSNREMIGFGLFVLATILFTRGSAKRVSVSYKVIGLSALAALLFASASLAGKFAFGENDFLGVLVLSRVFGVFTAGLIAVIAGAAVRKEVREVLLPSEKKHKSSITTSASLFAVVGQIFGGAGFVAIHLAMTQGSAAIVNALQSVQYGVLVLVGWLGGKRVQHILKEDTSRQSLIQKGVGIFAVALGLWILIQG